MEKQKKQGENKVKKQVIITLSAIAVILVLSVLAGVIFGAIANAVKPKPSGLTKPSTFLSSATSITPPESKALSLDISAFKNLGNN